MPWVALSANDVLAVMNSSEVATYQQFRQQAGQSDPLGALIGHVTSEIIAAIRVRHQVDAGGGIPQSTLGHAANLVAFRLMNRAGAKNNLEGREAAAKEAEVFISRIAKGEIGIELPVNASAEGISAPAPAIGHGVRPFRHGRGYGDWGP